MTYSYESKFELGQKVKVDGDKDIVARVIAISFGRGVQCQVTWWHDGKLIEEWVSEWRLEPDQ